MEKEKIKEEIIIGETKILEDGTEVTIKGDVIEIAQPIPEPIKENVGSLERKKHFLLQEVERGRQAQDEIKKIDELLSLIEEK